MNAHSRPQSPLDIQEIPWLLSKHRQLLVTGMAIGAILFASASTQFPRKYKSHFVLTIYTKYFQSPMVGDVVGSLGEFSEARAQRESLIRQTLSPDYLDELGSKYKIYASTTPAAPTTSFQRFRHDIKAQLISYGLYHAPSPESRLSGERQRLLARMDIFSLNNTTFNVGFSYSDPQVTYLVTQDLYAQIIKGLMDSRLSALVTVRDAIQKRLTTLPVQRTTAPMPTSRGPVQEELRSLQEQLRSLRALYSDNHPAVKELREKMATLQRQLEVMPAAPSAQASSVSTLPEADSTEIHDISGDLIKKLNYLDISIDSDQQHQADYFATLESPLFPTSASGPGLPLFVAGGVLFGFICALFIAAIREYFEFTAMRAAVVAQRLNLPMIGELPRFPQASSSPLNPASGPPKIKR